MSEIVNDSEQAKVELAKQVEAKLMQQVDPPKSMEEIIADREREVAEFKANPENQQKARQLAELYYAIFGERWFSLHKASVKTGDAEVVNFQKLKLLELFGLCSIRMPDKSNPKEREQSAMFKINLTKHDELRSLQDTIRLIEGQLSDLRQRETWLKREIELASTVAVKSPEPPASDDIGAVSPI